MNHKDKGEDESKANASQQNNGKRGPKRHTRRKQQEKDQEREDEECGRELESGRKRHNQPKVERNQVKPTRREGEKRR